MSLGTKRVLVVLGGFVLATVMVFLGLWQMDVFRAQGRQSIEERAAQPPVALDEVTQGTAVGDGYGRQVTITGRFLPDKQVYVGDTYPMRVVTAFRTTDGRIVAVVRGSVPAPTKSVPAPPSGEVTQHGVLLPTEDVAPRDVLPAQDLMQPRLQTLRLPTLAQSWPTPLLNGFVTLNAEEASAQRLDAPQLTLPDGSGSQRNAGYALQWWAFAAAVAVGSVAIARTMKPAA